MYILNLSKRKCILPTEAYTLQYQVGDRNYSLGIL